MTASSRMKPAAAGSRACFPQPRPGPQGRASFPAAFHLGAILPRGPPPRDSRPSRGPRKRNVQAASRPFPPHFPPLSPASQSRRCGGLLTSAGGRDAPRDETTELEVSTELAATHSASLYVIIGSPALPTIPPRKCGLGTTFQGCSCLCRGSG